MDIKDCFFEELLGEFLCESRLTPIEKRSSFAVILERCDSPSPFEIKNIGIRCGLQPLFFPLAVKSLSTARRYARLLSSAVIREGSLSGLIESLSLCHFSIADSQTGALLSLMAEVPVYLKTSGKGGREALSPILSLAEGGAVRTFQKNRLKEVKKVGLNESDLSDFSRLIRCEIRSLIEKIKR